MIFDGHHPVVPPLERETPTRGPAYLPGYTRQEKGFRDGQDTGAYLA